MPSHDIDSHTTAAATKPLTYAGFLRETRRLIALATPITVALAAAVLIGVVDTIMVAPLGTTALAAASITASVILVFYSALYGLVSICGVLVAQAFGGKDNDAVSSITKSGLLMSFFGGLLGAVLMILTLPLLPVLGQPQEVLQMIRPYWIAMSLVLLPYTMFYALKSLYDATERAWLGVIISFVAVVLNIPANWILIHGLGSWEGLGLLGAGLASLLAQMASLALAVLYWRMSPRMEPYRRRTMWGVREVAAQVRGGIPLALGYAGEGGAFSVAGLMLGLFGTYALAANQIVGSVSSVLYMAPLGMSAAVAIRVGQAIGEGERFRLRRIGLAALSVVVCWMASAMILVLMFGHSIARALSDDPAVIALAGSMFVIFAAMQIADGVQATALGALRGMLDNTWPITATLICYWCFALPFAYVLSVVMGVGPNGVWIGYGTGLVLASTILVGRFYYATRSRK